MHKRLSCITLIAAILLGITACSHTDKTQMVNLVQGMDYVISESPSPEYPDEGKKLTDGKYGTVSYSDTGWVGYDVGITKAVVFDLGEKKSIGKIKVNFLESGEVGIEFPQTVSFYASMDNKNWSTITHIGSKYEPWTNPSARTQPYVWDGMTDGIPNHPKAQKVYARYVKVTFRVSPMAFIDEVEIWGTDGKAKKAVELPANEYKYMPPSEKTGNIQNLVLLYNSWHEKGEQNWTKDAILPYISYVDTAGNPHDWFFDGILYLGLQTPGYRNFANPQAPTYKLDWEWYINKTFAESGDMSELNEAVKTVGKKLNQTKHKVKVVLMIPNPAATQDKFGDVGGDGIVENFQHDKVGVEKAFENRKKVVKWYIDTILKRWEKANYSHLELSGLYWLCEGVEFGVPHDEDLIRYASELVHKKNLKYYWIPWFFGNRSFAWQELGFDVAALQPNHFFYETDASRIQDASQLAKQYGMGMEIEFDERANTGEGDFKQRYRDYLNGGVDFGYMKDSFKAYYQGNTALLEAALSKVANIRSNYDNMYAFVKGNYSKK